MSTPIDALTAFFVMVGDVPKAVDDERILNQYELADHIEALATALGVELGADGDSIEMALRHKFYAAGPERGP